MCLCLCVHMYACMRRSMCRSKCTNKSMCTCMKRQCTTWAVTLQVLINHFGLGELSTPWPGPGCSAMEPMMSACLSFSSDRVHSLCFVLIWVLRMELQAHGCKTSTLPSELPPNPLNLKYNKTVKYIRWNNLMCYKRAPC